MARRKRNFTHEQKVMIGIGAASVLAVLTIATVVWAADSDPRPLQKAIEVAPGCASFTIASEQLLRDDLRNRIRLAAEQGGVDPFTVTSKYVRSIAPRCATYPSNVDTPGQVQLFAAVFMQVLEVMKQENYLSDMDYPTWYAMMTTWALGQGVSAEELQ